VRDVSSAWSTVTAFVSAVDASLGNWLVDTYRIGLTEYRALAHLTRAADKELRVNELAQRIGLNQSSVTRLLGRLEAKGLTRRDTCPDDGRGVYAVVTEQGASLVGEARGPYETRVRELLDNASEHYPQLDTHQLSRAFQEVGELASP
jgi:DNA-binding MarR family transcriptional regulator